MKKLILALIIAAAAGYGLLSYHFVLFDDSFKIVKKTGIRYQNTFVDARGTQKLDILLMPDLIEAGIKDVAAEVEKSINSN